MSVLPYMLTCPLFTRTAAIHMYSSILLTYYWWDLQSAVKKNIFPRHLMTSLSSIFLRETNTSTPVVWCHQNSYFSLGATRVSETRQTNTRTKQPLMSLQKILKKRRRSSKFRVRSSIMSPEACDRSNHMTCDPIWPRLRSQQGPHCPACSSFHLVLYMYMNMDVLHKWSLLLQIFTPAASILDVEYLFVFYSFKLLSARGVIIWIK